MSRRSSPSCAYRTAARWRGCSSRRPGADARPSVEPAPHGVDRGLDAVVDVELAEDARHVLADGARADVQLAADRGVVLAGGDQPQHLALAVAERDRLRLVRGAAGLAHPVE